MGTKRIAHLADTAAVLNSIVSDVYYGLVWRQIAIQGTLVCESGFVCRCNCDSDQTVCHKLRLFSVTLCVYIKIEKAFIFSDKAL